LGREVKIRPGKEESVKISNIFGTGQAYKTVIRITQVEYSDKTKWWIPKEKQEIETFTRD
jgi:hypothetical protein